MFSGRDQVGLVLPPAAARHDSTSPGLPSAPPLSSCLVSSPLCPGTRMHSGRSASETGNAQLTINARDTLHFVVGPKIFLLQCMLLQQTMCTYLAPLLSPPGLLEPPPRRGRFLVCFTPFRQRLRWTCSRRHHRAQVLTATPAPSSSLRRKSLQNILQNQRRVTQIVVACLSI